MATRAERFRSTTARQGEAGGGGARRKTGGAHKPSPAKQAGRLLPPEERRYGGSSTGLRNLSLGKKAIYALEDSPRRPAALPQVQPRGQEPGQGGDALDRPPEAAGHLASQPPRPRLNRPTEAAHRRRKPRHNWPHTEPAAQ